MKETSLPGPDAVHEHIRASYGDQRLLFRGESRDWGDTFSSLDRLQASKRIPAKQWPIFDERLSHIVAVLDLVLNEWLVFATPDDARRLGPRSLLDERDQLGPAALAYATLQHYGAPSPLVDLTENLEIALFFCSYPSESPTVPVVLFVVDAIDETISPRLVRMPDIDLYKNSRYARQRAHGLMLKLGSGIRDVNYIKGEDFRLLAGVKEKIVFPWPTEHRATYYARYAAPMLSIENDRLAQHVFEAFEHGLDQQAFEAIRVHEVFSQARNAMIAPLTGPIAS